MLTYGNERSDALAQDQNEISAARRQVDNAISEAFESSFSSTAATALLNCGANDSRRPSRLQNVQEVGSLTRRYWKTGGYSMLSLVETQNVNISNESVTKITDQRNKTSTS